MINNKIELDSAFVDANIITMDENVIVQGGIGCYKGKIVALDSSETILDMCSHNTEIHRLEGDFIAPGFIDSHRLLYEELFSPYFFKIEEQWGIESIAQEIDYFIIENYNPDFIFGYGFDENILNDNSLEDLTASLDHVSREATVFLLSSNEKALLFNSNGKSLLDEQGINYTNLSDDDLNKLVVLLDLDYKDLHDQLCVLTLSACECGITSIQNAMCPKIFSLALSKLSKVITDDYKFKTRILEETSHVMKDLELQRVCKMEDEDFINYFSSIKSLKIVVKDEKTTDQLLGFFDKLNRLTNLENLILYTDLSIPELDSDRFSFEIIKTWGYYKESSRVIEHSGNGAHAVNYLTAVASKLVGRCHDLGSIKVDNMADFAVFNNNPLNLTTSDFNKLLAEITVIGGKVVYNKEEETLSKEFDMMINQLI